MTATEPDLPWYLRDPAAYDRYLREGNAKQPRKRVSVDALIRDSNGDLLIVQPGYKPGWDLPGGMSEANEDPLTTLRRELSEELGLAHVEVGSLLCIDWVEPHGPWDDQIAMIFDAGVIDPDAICVDNNEIVDFQYVTPTRATDILRARIADLAASISEVGIPQSLVVIPGNDEDTYTAIIGQRGRALDCGRIHRRRVAENLRRNLTVKEESHVIRQLALFD